jgi:hypothetical protein
MTKNVQEALENVGMVYSDLVDIANDMLKDAAGDIDALLEPVLDKVETISNDELRVVMTKLSIRAFSFCEIKEKAAFKSSIAEILRKEKYATNFGAAEGSVAAKENTATLQTSAEILAEQIYDLVADLFKVKLDSIYRVVDVIKTVLTTRVNEAKLTSATGTATEF